MTMVHLALKKQFFVNFDRADFRISLSEAKSHAEADSDVSSSGVAPPKSRKNDEELISKTKKNRTCSESFFRSFGGRQAS